MRTPFTFQILDLRTQAISNKNLNKKSRQEQYSINKINIELLISLVINPARSVEYFDNYLKIHVIKDSANRTLPLA